ncbi:MAG: nucleoside hydrolase [Hungatella sp.]|nr:nucleoside hydrolase [Hungatella sp.]
MRRKVIIDCDPGIDDSLALMLALSMDEMEIAGITVVCGNCPTSMGTANAKKVLAYMNRLDIPVFAGEERPLKREYADALDTHGRDGLGESFLSEVQGYDQDMGAVEFLSEILRKETCAVIALGPMTNLARLYMTDPEAFGRIEEIVSMGGNFNSRGNCSPVAEYNYWADPDAAAMVYKAAGELGKEISMVGLDVTRKIVLTPDLLAYMKRLNPEIGAFVEKITGFYFDFHWQQEHLIGCVINDPLAVAYFADRSVCRGFRAYTQVETAGVCAGQTVVDFTPESREGLGGGQGTAALAAVNFYGKKANSVILTDVDREKFFRIFFSGILDKDEESLDLISALTGGIKG